MRCRGSITVVLLIGLFVYGCGVKGPPVPPRPLPMPAAVELAGRIEAGAAILTWRLTRPLAPANARRAAFGVVRSRGRIDQPACEDCPLVLERVATLPYIDPDNGVFSTEIPLDPGYRYVFKVHLEINGSAGPDSNMVRLDY